MLKHLCSALACALAYASPAAPSPAATQAWVKNFLAQREAERNVMRWSATIDGTNAEVELRFATEERRALRVSSSGDPRMPVGECFARTARGLYQNATNAFCDAVSIERVRVGWLFPDGYALAVATNGAAVTTNVVAATTNWLYRSAAAFSVGGSLYRGFRDGNAYRCVDVGDTNNTAEIDLVPHRQTAAERAATLTPRPSVSWLSILIPSANAGWTPGEWIATGNVVDDAANNQWLYEFERHYYFTPMSGGVDSLTVTINGVAAELPLSGFPELPPADSDYCEFSSGFTPDFDFADTLYKALAQALEEYFGMTPELARRWADRLVDAQPDAVVAATLQKFKDAEADAASGAPEKCPETKEEAVPKPEEEPEEEEPAPPPQPPQPECQHLKCAPGSSCGHWVCACCGILLDGPSAHGEWENRDGHCARCPNSFKGVHCPAASEEKSDHHFSMGDGDAMGCICANGRHWPHDDMTPGAEWESDENDHWKTAKCKTCGFERKSEYEPHQSADDSPWTDNGDGTCSQTGVCVCGYDMGVIAGPTPHSGELSGKVNKVDDSSHAYERECSRCSAKYNGDASPHTYALAQPPASCSEYDAAQHYYDAPCDFAASGCSMTQRTGQDHGGWLPVSDEYQFDSTNHWKVEKCERCPQTRNGAAQRHGDWQWFLSSSANVSDRKKCGTCGYEEIVPHNWAFNENFHYCTQDGQMHLYGAHGDDGDGHCGTCGYDANREIVRVKCEHCSCEASYQLDSQGNPDPSTASSNCSYGGVLGLAPCGCDACTAGQGKYCFCCSVYDMWSGKTFSICDPEITGDNNVLKALVGIHVIDGDDPVYYIGPNALEGVFGGFADLEEVRFNYVTNVGSEAFAHCFTNCPKLRSLGFQRLVCIGPRAFEDAFTGCTSLRNITFPTVSDVESHAFYDTVKGKTHHLTFPALVRVGVDAFSGASGHISLPAARFDLDETAFAYSDADFDLPALENLGFMSFAGYSRGDLSLPSVTDITNRAWRTFEYASITNLSLAAVSTNDVWRVGMDPPTLGGHPDDARPFWGLASGCVIHCSDGDVVVP